MTEMVDKVVAALLTIAWGASKTQSATAAEVRGIYKNMRENLT